jgi:hypothetical protein
VELQSIHTVPKDNGDSFGQLTGGEITLKGKLFEVPQFRALAETDRSKFAAFAFSLDDIRGEDYWNNKTFFIPLVDSPHYTSYDHLNICGLLLQLAGGVERMKRVFQRVGFTVVAKIDGSVALADHRVADWKPPPWSREEMEAVVII